MKSTKPWKVTINGIGFFVEAIKSTTAIDKAMWKYLAGKRTSFSKPINSRFLNYATISIEPASEGKQVCPCDKSESYKRLYCPSCKYRTLLTNKSEGKT